MREGWSATTLGAVVTMNPESLSTGQRSTFRYVDLSSVTQDTPIDESSLPAYSMEDAPGRARRIIRKGDVLVSTVRPYLRGFACVPSSLDGQVASTGFTVLRASPTAIDPLYVWALIRLPTFAEHLMQLATGSNYPAVRPQDVASFPILLPPLDEQRRIVDLIASVDEAIQGAESEAIAARVLLGALRTELIDRSDAPRAKLSDVLETVDGGRSPVTEGRPPGPGERGVLKVSAVRTGQFDFAELKAVSPAVSLPASALVSVGDVLITRSNTPETVGAVCFVDKVSPQTYLSDLTLRLTPRPGCLPAYLAAALTATEARRQITASAKGTSGSMRKISRQTIAELTIPLPDRDVQQSVVSLLDAAAASAKSVHASRAALRCLRSALLSELLSGDHEIPTSYDHVMV